MKLRARTDANQREIVAALRKVGASVETLHRLGKGVPDLLVGFQGQNFLIEVKTEKGKPTPDQREWAMTWQGQLRSAHSVDEAIGIVRQTR